KSPKPATNPPKSPIPTTNHLPNPPESPKPASKPRPKPRPKSRPQPPIKHEQSPDETVDTKNVKNPANMKGMLTISSDDDTSQKPPKPVTKRTNSTKVATKSRSKPPKLAKPATNTVDTQDLKMEASPDVKPNDDKAPKAPSRGKHHPDIYRNLTEEQRNVIHEDAKEDMQAFLDFNLPLSNNTHNWVRRGQPVLDIASCHSLKLAASVCILSNGRTVCPYHCIHKEPKAKDIDCAKSEKVTGVAYEPKKEHLRLPSYLEHPPYIDSFGFEKPPKPNSYNPNFTLERVLEFFILEPNDIRRLHCGCVLDEVLIEFSFWKRTMIQSPSTEVSEPLESPLRPRDRLYLVTILDSLHYRLKQIYHYDTKGRRVSRPNRLMTWVKAINGEISGLQGNADGVEKKESGAGSGASSSKRTLEYVEIPDMQVDGDGGSGEGIVPDPDIVRKDRIIEGRSGKGLVSNPDIIAGYEIDKGKGKAAAIEDLFSDSNYNGSDSDASNCIRSPSSLKRFSQVDLDHA
ncbi:hypothetical protein EST38_g14590, partial [Candolleomyces aberdarensis]